jgi:hypothetical protein
MTEPMLHRAEITPAHSDDVANDFRVRSKKLSGARVIVRSGGRRSPEKASPNLAPFALPKSMNRSGRSSTAGQSVQFQRVRQQLADLIAVIEIL